MYGLVRGCERVCAHMCVYMRACACVYVCVCVREYKKLYVLQGIKGGEVGSHNNNIKHEKNKT